MKPNPDDKMLGNVSVPGPRGDGDKTEHTHPMQVPTGNLPWEGAPQRDAQGHRANPMVTLSSLGCGPISSSPASVTH